MMRLRILFFILSIAAFELSGANELALPVTTCRRNESNYTTCLRLAIEEAWPRFGKGIPELEFPPFDPYVQKYESAVFNRGILNAEVNMTDIGIEGMANVHISSANAYFLHDVFHLEIDLKFPMVHTRTNCQMVGRLGEFRLYGKGQIETTSDSNVSWRLKGRVVNDTWIIKHTHVIPTINKSTYSVKNFFDGNEGLNNFISMFINEHWPMLYRLASKEISVSLNNMLSRAAELLFSKVSFSNTFPE